MRIFFLIIYTLTLTWQLSAQYYGSPPLRHFTPEAYKAEAQVWASTQDHRGVLYFALYDYILEYDGLNWRKIPLPDNNTARSLEVDQHGRVYVGAQGDFGYLKPDSVGELHYTSLLNKVDSANHSFMDIWNICAVGDTVYFNASDQVFCYYPLQDKQPVVSIPSENSVVLAFKSEQAVYVNIREKGVFRIENNRFVPMPMNSKLESMLLWIALPYEGNRFLLGNLQDGLVVYDPNATDPDKMVSKDFFDKDAIAITDAALTNNQLYHGVLLQNGTYAFSTISNGIYIVNKRGQITRQIRKQEGLKSNTVHHLHHDQQGGLWAATAFGIAHIEILSPINSWNETNGTRGTLYTTKRHNNTLYVSSNVGLYRYQNKRFAPVPQLCGKNAMQVFSLESFLLPDSTQQLLVGTKEGVYQIYDNKISRISDYIPFEMYQSRQNRARVYMDQNNELVYLDYKNGRWIEGDTLASLDEIPGAFEEDEFGNLWMVINEQACYYSYHDKKIHFVPMPKEKEDIAINDISKQNNRLLFLTNKGFYRFKDTLSADTALNRIYGNADISEFEEATTTTNWVNYEDNGIAKIDKLLFHDGTWKQDTLALRRLPSFDTFRPEGDSLLWVVSANTLFLYHAKQEFTKNIALQALTRSVHATDSLLFKGSFFRQERSWFLPTKQQNKHMLHALQYKNNDITFEFALPNFDSSTENEYKYTLLADGDTAKWSAWTHATKKEYTNLWEGTYEFLVVGKDTYGRTSRIAKYAFIIHPPIYRTLWAYLLYALSIAAFIYLLLWLNSRRMKRENERLEQIITDRTAEISNQNEEIQRQANTLQNNNIQLFEKNEEINQQNEEIQAIVENLREVNKQVSEQHTLITDSIRYAQRIQEAVLPRDGLLEKLFPGSMVFFRPRDIVSGDFYFVKEIDDLVVAAVADCTGHGVPGAFMSMLSIALLNEIIRNNELESTGDVLEELRMQVKSALHQTREVSAQKDGLDIALCAINRKTNTLQFSGANNPLYLIRNGEITTYAAVRNPIGIYLKEKPFTSETIALQPGDCIYMSSDGYPDQFGGKRGGKLKYKRFRDLLLEIHQLPDNEQQKELSDFLERWQAGIHDQVDDILVMGIKV